jgi:hypothetical protein
MSKLTKLISKIPKERKNDLEEMAKKITTDKLIRNCGSCDIHQNQNHFYMYFSMVQDVFKDLLESEVREVIYRA